MRILVNADDFGLTKTSTDAILECFKKGLISTTTMVANGEYFLYALDKVKGTQFIDKIGIHINLTEGKPLTNGISKNKKFCDSGGNFICYPYRYARLNKNDKQNVYDEIEAQFDRIIKSGIKIHHVDSHHHVHNSFRILPIVLKIMKDKNVFLIRRPRNAGKIILLKRVYKFYINLKIRKYLYSNYMGSLDDFELIKNKRFDKTFEIMVHPDYNGSNELIDRDNGDYNKPTGTPFNHSYNIIK